MRRWPCGLLFYRLKIHTCNVASVTLQNELLTACFYTFIIYKMDEKQLTVKTIWELTPEELQELDLEEWDELLLFEWDPDYMVTPWASENYMTPQNHIYFFIWSDKNLVITSDYSDFDDELLEFCKWQDTKVSKSGYNTRSETWHWQFMEYWDNAWESFEKCKNLKIAYRWWCGYVYTLFERVESKDE